MLRWLGLRPPFLYRACLVNLKSDPDMAFRAVPWQTRDAWIVLRHVAIVKGSTVTALDGDVVVHRSNVAFLQVLPEAAS